MLDQNVSTSGAPGMTHAIPTMAMSRSRRGATGASSAVVIGIGGGPQSFRVPRSSADGAVRAQYARRLRAGVKSRRDLSGARQQCATRQGLLSTTVHGSSVRLAVLL